METAAGLLRLKPDTEPDVREWRDTLIRRRDEAVETLRNEGVEVESWFEAEIEGKPYLIWYMRSPSIERAWEVFHSSQLEIDQFHHDLLGSITDGVVQAKPLIDLSLE